MRAQVLDELCTRWGQLPSAVLREDAYLVLRMRSILREAVGEGDEEE